MIARTTGAFDLPDPLSAKADPALVAHDEQHLAAVARRLEQTVTDLTARLDAERTRPAGSGQRALDRDQEIHRLTARLRLLSRFGATRASAGWSSTARTSPCTSGGWASPALTADGS